MPRSAWPCYRARFAPVGAARVYNDEGLSDHAPMILCGLCRAHRELDARPVPQEIAASPELAEHLAALVLAADLEATSMGRPIERLLRKALLREAARLARDKLLSGGAPTQTSRGAGDDRAAQLRKLGPAFCGASWRCGRPQRIPSDARANGVCCASWRNASRPTRRQRRVTDLSDALLEPAEGRMRGLAGSARRNNASVQEPCAWRTRGGLRMLGSVSAQ